MSEGVTISVTKSMYYKTPQIGDVFGGGIIIRKTGNQLTVRPLSSIKLFRFIEIKWYRFLIKKGWLK